MNAELFLLYPPDGFVFSVSTRVEGMRQQLNPQLGFCRRILFAGDFVSPGDSFSRASDPAMTTSWPEARDFGFLPIPVLAFDIVRTCRWMNLPKPRNF